MAQPPFVRRPGSPDPALGRRRSSRVEAAIPIILTGRDAAGQPFREETETLTVNLHGGRLRTRYQVLVGMQVGIENPRTGVAEKAICVRFEEAAPGQSAHYIAVQLLHPGNVWGVEPPPADWEEGVAEWRARLSRPSRATKGEATAQATPTLAPAGSSGPLEADVRFAGLELRVAQLMESALEIVRKQADEIAARTLRDFEERLAAASTAGEMRFTERIDQAFAELESALSTFRADLDDELTARREQAVASAVATLQAKLSSLASPVLEPGAKPSPDKPAPQEPKK